MNCFTGNNLVLILSFWILNGLLLIVDVTGKPDWLIKYKVQEDQNVPVRIIYFHFLSRF